MAILEINVSSPVLIMNGTTTVTSSINWADSDLPSGAVISGATLKGTWAWNGRGSIRSLTIGGTSTSDLIAFTHTLSASEISGKSIAISATGDNKNCTGNNFTWTDLIITYEYEVPVIKNILYIKKNGIWEEMSVVGYKKINDVWVEQDIETLFDVNVKYKKGVI